LWTSCFCKYVIEKLAPAKTHNTAYCCGVNFCADGTPLTNNNYKPGGKMNYDFEENKFIIYLMIGMIALGFAVMLLV
jgi:hypothetical protein